MEGRLRVLLLAALGLPALAQAAEPANPRGGQAVEPQLERRTIAVPAIDTEDFEVGFYVGAMSIEDFGVNPVVGVRGAYHVSENFFIEATLGGSRASETSYETLSGSVELLTDDQRRLTYYTLSVGYNLFHGEAFFGNKRAFNTAVYLVGGVGSTSFADDSRFSVNLGLGYRFLVTDWLALHADFRDHIWESDLLGERKTTHNLEAHGGLTIFF